PVERVGPAADRAEVQATRVERVAFRAGRLGMGYDEDEVDAFLDRIVATLRGTTGQPLTAREVREVTFSIVLFKPGYAVGEVDEFLAELADVIARCHAAE
ncbi:MAG TPA: DivIVA domain-containing protein, partial [Thermopolyspora sp.]